jgi:hypothetical protein
MHVNWETAAEIYFLEIDLYNHYSCYFFWRLNFKVSAYIAGIDKNYLDMSQFKIFKTIFIHFDYFNKSLNMKEQKNVHIIFLNLASVFHF